MWHVVGRDVDFSDIFIAFLRAICYIVYFFHSDSSLRQKFQRFKRQNVIRLTERAALILVLLLRLCPKIISFLSFYQSIKKHV